MWQMIAILKTISTLIQDYCLVVTGHQVIVYVYTQLIFGRLFIKDLRDGDTPVSFYVLSPLTEVAVGHTDHTLSRYIYI